MRNIKITITTIFFVLSLNNIYTNDDNKPNVVEYRDSLAGEVNNRTKNTEISDSDKPDGEFKYWITKSSNKRHNRSCKYYKSSNGRGTDNSSEGKQCRLCGS